MQYEDGKTSPVRAFFENKWIRIILAVSIPIIIILVIALSIILSKTATLNLYIAPLDASIQLNGQTGYTNGAYKLRPGTYTVTISREGLEPKTFSVELVSGYVATLTTFLSGPDHNFDFYLLKNNYDSMQLLESIASANNNITTDRDTSAESFIAEFEKTHALYQKELPITNYEYQETPGPSPRYITTKDINITASSDDACQKFLCLKAVMFLTEDKDFVDNLLVEKGFNLKLCEVIYEIPYVEN